MVRMHSPSAQFGSLPGTHHQPDPVYRTEPGTVDILQTVG